MRPQPRPALYELLEALPEGLTGEILSGQLHTQPRPTWPHAYVSGRLNRTIGRRFDDGDDGPGGWWIIAEPEIHFVLDEEVVVPDLAGWRRERMPIPPEGHRVLVVPDWVCEILSPSTASRDRDIKMPLYAHYGVSYAWLVDPKARSLEAFRLEAGAWQEVGRFAGDDRAAVPPFEAITLDLGGWWL
jgi:Uma2 family endonuclease